MIGPDVAAAAGISGGSQRKAVIWLGRADGACGFERHALLGERRMALHAFSGVVWLETEQLADDAGRHRLRMPGGLPLRQLIGVARPARRRRQ